MKYFTATGYFPSLHQKNHQIWGFGDQRDGNIPWKEDDYRSNSYCRLHNEHLSTIYLCHHVSSSPIYSWKNSYHALIFTFLSNKAAQPGLRLKYHRWQLWWALLYNGTCPGCRIRPKQMLLNKDAFLAVFHWSIYIFNWLFLCILSVSALLLSKFLCISCIFRDLEHCFMLCSKFKRKLLQCHF